MACFTRNESFSFLHGGKQGCQLRICDWVFLSHDCTKMQSGELWSKKRSIVVLLVTWWCLLSFSILDLVYDRVAVELP